MAPHNIILHQQPRQRSSSSFLKIKKKEQIYFLHNYLTNISNLLYKNINANI